MKESKILRRQRVEEDLDNLTNYPLTIVSATMGYGKTTSVRTYLTARDLRTIWIPLLGCDGDEMIFWHKLSMSVGKLYPEFGKRLERLGFPIGVRQTAAIIDLFWNLKNEAPLVLVIDDYHLINQSTQLGTLIELLAEEEIPNLHILLLTRTRPKFNHMNLISKGLCYYLDTDTSSFTMQEIKEYLDLMVVNDADKMVKLSQMAEKLLGEGEVSTAVLRNDIFTFGMPHFLYTYYREAGKLKETVDCIKTGFPPKVFDGCGTGCEFVVQAEYALEIGDFQNAEMFSKKAIYKAKTMKQMGIILCAYFTMMRLSMLRGNFSAAKEEIATMRNVLLDLGEKIKLQDTVIYNAAIDMCEGYLYSYLHLPDLIPEWLRSGDIGSRTLMLRGMGYPYIIYGKAIMLTKNWIEVEILSESFDEGFSVFHNQLGLLYNSIYSATAKYNLYGMEAGINAILPALSEAQSDGIMIPFAENAEFVLPMLNELKKSEKLDQRYLEGLIRLCEQCNENLKLSQGCTVELTNREIEVLHLLAQGLTQREMAQRLYLSVSSIKKHLENIYGKLNVNNKIRAVQKAQELNILKN